MQASYAGFMRGGVARWKRGVAGHGLRAATAYALGGVCDASGAQVSPAEGIEHASHYADEHVTRFTVNAAAGVAVDELDRDELRAWIDGRDPETREKRGRQITGANADLLFDATVNTPKSLSLAAMLDDELAAGLEALHDRIRDRALELWRRELNARRGAGGAHAVDLAQIEVVELHHERSRALDPHAHRHLWLNAKVLGVDGQWSNVDSRVLLRFQNILNAEGDLAASTDPQWRALLAAKGFTVDAATGEISELSHLVSPLSRRSRQIEAARATKLAQWHDEHPGMSPSPQDLRAIDQWAWAYGRPGKPKHFDETEWRKQVLNEIRDIDGGVARRVTKPRSPAPIDAVAIADLDRDWLAAAAAAAADARSTSTSGRMSRWDVTAATTRVIAATGVVTDRDTLDELLEDVTERVIREHLVTLLGDTDVPPHVRGFVAHSTVAVKAELDDRLAGLAARATPVDVALEEVAQVAEAVTEHGLDERQAKAASVIAGSAGVVTVEGPAGAGKTTMLTVARHCLEAQGRKLLLVAPTKKAALVAGRETGAPATSVHALLYEVGWRWGENEHGRTEWQRLQPGDIDPASGEEWQPRELLLDATTRIVVDEAGMIDLDAAAALTQLCEETGAGVAFVGDPRQVLPVGHSGAMSLAQRHATTHVELEAIHRFHTADGGRDTAWAELSRRLRQPKDAADARALAEELVARQRVRVVSSSAEATTALVDTWFDAHGTGDSVAVVVATNEEARVINDTIQQRRVERGQLRDTRDIEGRDGQRILVGDLVQTRRNASDSGVENRATWRVTAIRRGQVTLESTGVDDTVRTVPPAYAHEHLQLAYAVTPHGIQGETVQRSIVGPGVDAAGLYVGLTRGKRMNEVVVVAGSEADAKDELVAQMSRGEIEVDLADSRSAALRELGAAARKTGTPIPPWQVREYGRIVRLDAAIAAGKSRLPFSDEAIQFRQDRIDALRSQLVELERDDAVQLATSDLRARDIPLAPNPERLTVRQQIDTVEAELSRMRKENRPVSEVIEALQLEKNLRELVLPIERRQREDRERLAHARAGDGARRRWREHDLVYDAHAPQGASTTPAPTTSSLDR